MGEAAEEGERCPFEMTPLGDCCCCDVGGGGDFGFDVAFGEVGGGEVKPADLAELTRDLGLRLRARARSSAKEGELDCLDGRIMGAKYPSCFSVDSVGAGVGDVMRGVGGIACCAMARTDCREEKDDRLVSPEG